MQNSSKKRIFLIGLFFLCLVISGGSIFLAIRIRQKKKVTPEPGKAAQKIIFGECSLTADCQKPVGCCTEGYCENNKCVRYVAEGKCLENETCGGDCQCVAEEPTEDKKGSTGTCDQPSQCQASWGGCGECCDTCTCKDHACVGWRSTERCRLVLKDESATCNTECKCEVGGTGVSGSAGCYFKNGSAADTKCDGQAGCPKISVDEESGRVIYSPSSDPKAAASGYQICYCDKVQGGCEVDCQAGVERTITSSGFPCGTIQADDNEGFCIWKGPNDCSTPPSGEISCQSLTRSPSGSLSLGQEVTLTAAGLASGTEVVRIEFKLISPSKTEKVLICPGEDPPCKVEFANSAYSASVATKAAEAGEYSVCARICDQSGKCTDFGQ